MEGKIGCLREKWLEYSMSVSDFSMTASNRPSWLNGVVVITSVLHHSVVRLTEGPKFNPWFSHIYIYIYIFFACPRILFNYCMSEL